MEERDRIGDGLDQMVPLALEAIAIWQQLESELDCDLELKIKGGLMVAESGEDTQKLQDKCRLENQHGLDTAMVDGDEARAMAPYLGPSVVAAAWCRQEGSSNPRLVTPAFARRARENGAELCTHTAVTAISRLQEGWLLDCQREHLADSARLKIDARAVVNCCGAWAARIAAMTDIHLPIFPLGLTMNVTEETSPFITHLVQHIGRKLSLKQTRNGNVLIGGGWPARVQQTDDQQHSNRPLLDMESVRGNVETAVGVVPAISRLHLLRCWTGTVGTTSDQMPVVGEVPGSPGFFVVAGGSAFTMGPVYAKLISRQIVTGQTSELLAALSPARFGQVNSSMGTGS